MCFVAWCEVWNKERLTRGAFQVKSGVVEQELRVRKHREGHEKRDETRVNSQIRQTLMQKHSNRTVQCRHCSDFYVEATNHSRACAYHPGSYTISCPKSCPHYSGDRPASKGIHHSCMSHYRRRWSCCDDTNECAFGKGGCERRWHISVDHHPAYSAMLDEVREKKAREEERQEQMRKEQKKWTRRARLQNLQVVSRVEEQMRKERAVVARFDSIDARR